MGDSTEIEHVAGTAPTDGRCGESTGDELPLDVVFDVLKNQRRRLAIRYLHENPGPVAIRDLSAHIAAIETEKDRHEISAKERKRVYVSLYQWHLQKMADADIVETDRKLNVELGPNGPAVYRRLEASDRECRDRWRTYGTVTAIAGVAVLLGVAFGGTERHLAVGAAIGLVLATATWDARSDNAASECQ